MGYKADQTTFSTTHRPSDQRQQPKPQQPSLPQRIPPPLPPREFARTFPITLTQDSPPPYSVSGHTYHSQPLSHSWTRQDPRSSSAESLVPHEETNGNGKRTMLLVYIHGFMGDETSFQSFPAHVHNLVTVKLEDSHDVHTKIYPRYKSRKHIEFARDAFSEWLQPHESLDTDVILLGHSMGGLLSAEVALLKEHRIVGTINFDTPFLGMHPGVIASGLGSVFRPAPDTPGQKPTDACQGNQEARPVPAEDGGETQPSAAPSYYPSEESSLTPIETSSTTVLPISSSASIDMPVKDSTYDPPFVNDVRIPQRTGWANALHFINKHSDGLRAATTSYVRSHLEFGGAMADYTGLKNRYGRLRMLEDVDSKVKARIRFVNYYTASTGRPKKHKSAPTSATMSRVNTGQLDGEMSEIEESGNGSNLELSDKGFSSSCLKIPIDRPEGVSESSKNNASRMTEHSVGETQAYSDEEGQISDASEAMDHIQPNSMPDSEQTEAPDSQEEPSTFQRTRSTADLDSIPFEPSSFASNAAEPRRIMPSLPPVPPTPSEPPAFDAASYTDKDTRKLAEKEHSRQVKAYRQALKDREKSISDRQKFLEKRERAAAKEREKLTAKGEKERLKVEQKGMEKGEKERSKQEREELKRLEKERVRMEKEAEKLKGKKEDPKPPVTATPPGDCAADEDGDSKPEKPKRDRKFCMLPSMINGQLDPCWIRVFMPGVDEVGAHCGLFTVDGERYQRFVEDVAERIEAWVIEGRV